MVEDRGADVTIREARPADAVFERNVAAIEFDRKAGFVVEGRQRHAAFRDGEYLDDVIMALVW